MLAQLKTLPWPIRYLFNFFLWPVTLTFISFQRFTNKFVKISLAFVLSVVVLPLWWIVLAGVYVGIANPSSEITTANEKSEIATTSPQPENSASDVGEKIVPSNEAQSQLDTSSSNPQIEISYSQLSTSCDDYYFAGSLKVTNESNVPVTGRVEIPVETYEKFIIPLSGVFYDLQPSESQIITLEGGEGCKEDQVLGDPYTVFTIPSESNLNTINRLNAFTWSNESISCDGPSGLIRLIATVRNDSEFTLTAGFQAYVLNGEQPESYVEAGVKGTSYFGSVYQINPGEERKVDFGYGGFCIKDRKEFDGPYAVEFETRFTY